MSTVPETSAQRLSGRPLYTPQQLHTIYERLGLPSRFRYEPGDFSREVVRHKDGIGFLTALQRHTLASVPFENLELHYSPHHQISIHADALFDKIVRQGTGRGGYGIESNSFLGTMLRSVGFNVMTVGARVNTLMQPFGTGEKDTHFSGFSHLVNLVTVRGHTFLIDVGFGAGGPTQPLELVENNEISNVLLNQKMRLRRDAIPENEHRRNKLWILERRDDGEKDDPWLPLYCFDDSICFLPQDFEIMNYFISTHRQSFYTYRVLCSKALLDDNEEAVIGEVFMYEKEVYRRVRGVKETLCTLQTEAQRLAALSEHFGIQLSEAQREGIKGMMSELGATVPIQHS